MVEDWLLSSQTSCQIFKQMNPVSKPLRIVRNCRHRSIVIVEFKIYRTIVLFSPNISKMGFRPLPFTIVKSIAIQLPRRKLDARVTCQWRSPLQTTRSEDHTFGMKKGLGRPHQKILKDISLSVDTVRDSLHCFVSIYV